MKHHFIYILLCFVSTLFHSIYYVSSNEFDCHRFRSISMHVCPSPANQHESSHIYLTFTKLSCIFDQHQIEINALILLLDLERQDACVIIDQDKQQEHDISFRFEEQTFIFPRCKRDATDINFNSLSHLIEKQTVNSVDTNCIEYPLLSNPSLTSKERHEINQKEPELNDFNPSTTLVVIGVVTLSMISLLTVMILKKANQSQSNEHQEQHEQQSNEQSLLSSEHIETPSQSYPRSDSVFDREEIAKESKLLSMAYHPVIPLSAKIMIPILMVCIVVTFLIANIRTGASVKLSIKILDKKLLKMDLFNFSLINTIREMWQGEAYLLSVLVAAWSGIWVYTKAIIVAACWFVPPKYLKLIYRRRLLLALDALGKYCTLDIFLMCMMSVAFKLHITTNTMSVLNKYLPKDFVVVDIEVDPTFGLFGFITATALSLVLNHSVLYFHRNTIGYDGVSDNPSHFDDLLRKREARHHFHGNDDLEHDATHAHHISEEKRSKICCPYPQGSWFDVGTVELLGTTEEDIVWERERLINHRFADRIPVICESNLDQIANLSASPDLDSGSPLRFGFKILLTFLLVTSGVLIIVFANLHTFEFTFGGLAGAAIKIIAPEEVTKSYSLVEIAESLADNKANPDQGFSFGIFYMQLCFLLFSIVLPVVTSILLTILWLIPMNLRELKLTFYASEVAQAWAAIDVYILSVIAVVLEIDQFSLFLQQPICDPITKIIPVDALPDKRCFTVGTTLEPLSFVFLAFALFTWFINQSVTRLAERSIRDKEAKIHAKLLSIENQ